MAWFWVGTILGAILLLLFIANLITRLRGADVPHPLGLGIATLAVVGISFSAGSFYTQDGGEAKLLKSISGDIAGVTYDTGFHGKAPWVAADTWDIRQNLISYIADGKENYNGGSASGPRITTQDRDGVDANFDLEITYSIEGDKVPDLYVAVGSQQNLVERIIQPDIRSVMRSIPDDYSTIEILNKRDEIQIRVFDALKAEWESMGIVIEDVNVQEIVQPEAIKNANAAKAAAAASVETERSNLERARIEAERNLVASTALTPEVLEQKRIEALYKAAEMGSLIVVPEDFNGIINLPAPQ